MNWEKKHIDIGQIVEKDKVKVVFVRKDKTKTIADISPRCGCTKVRHRVKEGLITTSYKGANVPYGRRDIGWFETTKYIDILYTDETKETLSFTVKITKK